MQTEINILDFALAFLYVVAISAACIYVRLLKIKTQPHYKYFYIGLLAKMIGGIYFAIFSVFYYKGGDSLFYFEAGKACNEYITENMAENIGFFVNPYIFKNNHDFLHQYMYGSRDVLTIVYHTTIISFLGLKSYLVCTILFSFISFVGLWLGYSNLCKMYPNASKYLLIGFFLVPTAIMWSSGILKDTITQGAIGWILYSVSNIFVFKRRKSVSFIIIFLASWAIFNLKPYLLYVYIPCLLIWIQSIYKAKIKSIFFKVTILPILFISLILLSYFISVNLSKDAGKYGFDKLGKTLEGFHSWHGFLAATQDQSGYSFGEFEFTPLGILSKVPASLNVTYFRPYLWEVRNLPTLLGAIEGFVLLLFCLYLLVKLRLGLFTKIYKNKEAYFMMLFALIFGVVVGISSYNFGALSRYKIPAEMFFITSLILVYCISLGEKRIKNR